jgi:hypothetical protein
VTATVDIAIAEDKPRAAVANAGAVAGGLVGGRIGATAGLVGGPFAEFTVPAVGIAGAIVGGIVGYDYAQKKYDEAMGD